jgi:hypothetical protein
MVDRFFPQENPGPEPKIDPNAVDSLRRFEGHYRSNRMAETTFEKIGALMGGATVRVDGDGALVFEAGEAMRMGEIEPLLFQEIGGSRRVRFFESEDGEITKMFRDDIPIFAYDRTPKTELLGLHLTLLAIALPILLSGAIAWPFGAFRRRKEEPAFSQEHLPGAAKWTAWAASVALLAFVIGFFFTMADPVQIVYGLPPQLPVLLCLPLIGTALTYVAVLFGLLFCVRRIASFWARMHYLAVVAACAVVVWQLHTWNLLGFRY